MAILPLVRRGRTVFFLGHGTSDYNDLLVTPDQAPAALAAALDLLLRHSDDWDECCLHNVSETSVLAESVELLPRALRCHLARGPDMACSALDLRIGRDEKVHQILEETRARRAWMRLQRLGSLEFRRLTDITEMGKHLPIFTRQHIARRALAGDCSQFLDPRSVRFHRKLFEEFASTDAVRFFVLETDGRPVAYHLGFEMDRRFSSYTHAFDIDLWDRSPGLAMRYHILNYARTASVDKLDFTQGDESYKAQFADLTSRNLRWHLFARTRAGRLLRARLVARETLRRLPRLYRLLRAVTRSVGELRRRAQRSVRKHGLAAFLGNSVRWASRTTLYCRHNYLVYAARSCPSAGDQREPGISVLIRPVTLTDLAVASTQDPDFLTPGKLKVFRLRLRRGDEAYGAYKDGRLVHMAWLHASHETAPEAELRSGRDVTLPGPGFMIFDCWTAPPFRRRGVYQAVLRFLIELCLDGQTAGAVWICCEASNVASQAGIEAVGFGTHSRISETTFLGRFRNVEIEAVTESPRR